MPQKLRATIKAFVLQNILTHPSAFAAERIIRARIAQLQQKGFDFAVDNKLDLDALIHELKDYLEKESNRRTAIDDKAKSSLFIITISTTVILAGLNLIKEGKVTFGLPLTLIIVIGVVYLVLSGITATKALHVSVYYAFHPDAYIRDTGSRPIFTELKKIDTVHLLYEVLKLNEQLLVIRSNFVDATLVGIRNGIILLSLAFVVAVGNVGRQVKNNENGKDQAVVEQGPVKNQPNANNNGNTPTEQQPPLGDRSPTVDDSQERKRQTQPANLNANDAPTQNLRGLTSNKNKPR